MTIDELTLLKQIPYFQELKSAELEIVLKDTVIQHHPAGKIIFSEGEPSAGIYLVVSGKCKIYRLSREGREQVLSVITAGGSCNEVSVVDNEPNPASVMAVENSRVMVISAEAMQRLRQTIPGLNETISRNLAKRCRELVQRIYILSFLPVTGRLAFFLLNHSKDNLLSRQEWTHDEIAAHLGTVREMIGRSFKELEQREMVKVNRNTIRILNPQGLRDLT
jgi:CRP-like cAMP-binding protein